MKTFHFFIRTLLWSAVLFLAACNKDAVKEEEIPTPDPNQTTTSYALGWTGEDDLKTVPVAPNFGFGNDPLPVAVDLTTKFPPIGDQGNYGTCVSWALGYNIKTAINGIENGLSANDLKSAANQFSPKDLFVAIPDNEKGEDCNGTNFSYALNVMQNRGVATLKTVPYTNLGDCSQANLQQSWTKEANQNKIKYWRKIDASIQSIKQNLANNIPVIMGAKLADNFMTWNSDQVLSSGTSFNNVGQHAYHAMVVGGYDDNKGPNGAFRVINSWSTQWGDRGYIWIDYNYFMNEFCTSFDGEKPLFIAANDGGDVNPPDDDDPAPPTTGVDLAPWVFSDFSTYWTSGVPNEREIDFNLYNIGNQAATPNSNWSYYYIYFNAYNSNDYGVLFYDEFSSAVPRNTFDCPKDYSCVFNYTIPAGGNFANTVWGWQSISRTYYMPAITGYYYLVMVADAGDAFNEQDELNNLFYTTQMPKWFTSGYGLKEGDAQVAKFKFENPLSPKPSLLQENPYQTAVKPRNPNAYTPEEVLGYIKSEKNNGNLQNKVNEYMQRSGKNFQTGK